MSTMGIDSPMAGKENRGGTIMVNADRLAPLEKRGRNNDGDTHMH